MSIAGKKSVHFTKKDLQDQKVPAIGFKKIQWAHEPTVGDTEIDLASLVLPSSGIPASFVNPSAADLAAAKLLFNQKNLLLISSYKGLLSFDDYEIKSNTVIKLKDAVTDSTEIFMGIIDPIAKTGLQVVDVDPIVVTGVLAASADEFIVGKPFDVNKYSTTQQGSILVFLDGQLMARNVGNQQAASGDGDYYEVDPGGGASGNSIKFNQTSAQERSVMVVSNGLAFAAPNDSLKALIESLNSQVDLMIPTLAALAGVSETSFQGAPNSVDLTAFGDRMLAAEADIDANEARLDDLESDSPVAPWYEEVTVVTAGSGDLTTSADLLFVRVGNLVTMTAKGSMNHTNLSSAQSATDIVPVGMRPPAFLSNVMSIGSTLMRNLDIYTDGRIGFQYRDYSGSATANSGTSSIPTMSWVVE